ncbi:Tat pathway signal protein [Asticcacaulis sp. DW145]|uniref:Tat pathway signal protein n=1 Tax=Asticcacaulis currens TaxID=2984210 RepID=A0ABT5ID40_9CAUL|nr:Tat pathway signal protein [Asticcacaulis currens]MDC7694096.1 Tat pathway signal protein [Asticcacaulis currens]BEV09947.1 Tat pathway signal protein [Asticcacaulis sp. DW145]
MNRRDLLRWQLSGLTLMAVGGAASQALASGAPKKKGGGADFVQMPLLTVFTKARGGKHGTLTVEVGLDTNKNEKLAEMLSRSVPRLRDAYVARLQAYAMGLTASSVVDLDYMTRELQTATDAIIKQKGVRVLLGSVVLA